MRGFMMGLTLFLLIFLNIAELSRRRATAKSRVEDAGLGVARLGATTSNNVDVARRALRLLQERPEVADPPSLAAARQALIREAVLVGPVRLVCVSAAGDRNARVQSLLEMISASLADRWDLLFEEECRQLRGESRSADPGYAWRLKLYAALNNGPLSSELSQQFRKLQEDLRAAARELENLFKTAASSEICTEAHPQPGRN